MVTLAWDGDVLDDLAALKRFATIVMAHPRKKQKSNRRARRVLEKPPLLGWRTSDEDELNLRRWRGRAEIAAIEALEPQYGPFGTFRVRSNSGSAYEVEIRDLAGRNNSCGCIDHRVNGLGTCKHIEGCWRRSGR